MEFKQLSQEVKDMDIKKGIVVAYANVYGNEDDDGDISDRGSFNKTVIENKKRLRVLKDHDRRVSLGIPLDLDASDYYGLKTTTQFNMKKEVSRDMFTDIQLAMENDQNADLSIGYDVMRRDPERRQLIKEYRLWEYSFLSSWGSNELATVQGMKGLKTTQDIISYIEKAYNLDYSDSRLRKLETLLKSLSTTPPTGTSDDEPIDTKEFRNKILLTYKSVI